MRPENTIPAFEYAIEAGVDALELDMAVTADGVLVVSHDPVLEAPVCTGPVKSAMIHQLKFAELTRWDCGSVPNPKFPKQVAIPGTRMPTLDSVFQLAGRGNFDFDIETKIFRDKPAIAPSPEEFVRLVLAEVRKHHLERRVILQSFDFRTLLAMKKVAPEIRLAALYEGPPRDFVAIAMEAGAGIISPLYTLVTPAQVKEAHAQKLVVIPWTANDPRDWDALIAAGVDAIITDDPAALISHLRSKGLR